MVGCSRRWGNGVGTVNGVGDGANSAVVGCVVVVALEWEQKSRHDSRSIGH